jgi:hypothetical protein
MFLSYGVSEILSSSHIKPASGKDWSRKDRKINNQKVELQPLKFGWFSLPETEPEFVSLIAKTNALNFFMYYPFFFLHCLHGQIYGYISSRIRFFF